MKKHDSYLYFAVLLSIIFISINLYVINKDKTPYAYDMANLRSFSLDYFSYINNGSLDQFYNLFRRDYFYPPFYILGSLPFYFIFGTSQDVSTLVNVPFAIILILSVYFIGKKISTPEIGLLSAALVALTPAIFSFSRVFLMDFAVCAAVALSICLMIYTDKFSKKNFNMFFGLSIGLGMMMKWSYAVYMIGPIISYFFYSFKSKEYFSLATLKNKEFNIFLIGLGIGLVVPLIWYYDKIWYILSRAGKLNYDYSLQIGGFKPFTFQNFSWYLHSMYFPLLRHFFAFFTISLAYFMLFVRNRHKSVLAAWFIVPYIIYTFSVWKDSRYLLGALPALGIMGALATESLVNATIKAKMRDYSWKYALAGFLVLLSCVHFSVLDKGRNHPFSIASLSSDGLYTWHDTYYPINEMQDIIFSKAADSILIIPNSLLIDTFAHEIEKTRPDIVLDRGLFCIGSGGANNCREKKLERFSDNKYACSFDMVISYEAEFDYFLYGVIYLPENSTLHSGVIMPMVTSWNECKSSFDIAGKFTDITNSNQSLYFYKSKKLEDK